MKKPKYNFVLIFKDSIVPELPESQRDIIRHDSAQGWASVTGCWDESQINQFEYYDINSDWEELSGWEDVQL